MKKNLKTLVTAAVIILPLITFAQAQKSGFNLNKKYSPGGTKTYAPRNKFEVQFRSDIPIRAFRNLIKHYNDVSNLHWYNTENGFFAQFDASGVQTRAEFDEQGFWRETITNFTEDQTPEDIKKLVKEAYNNFNIIVAHKIETNAASVFIVKIENETQLKTLEIKNGVMELTGDYVKE
jgi:hypothetical protein